MAYKKYIMKNGKLYGPYLYESKRINGKVVSQYHGTGKEKINLKKYAFVLVIVFLSIGFIYGIFSFQKRITSNVILGKEESNELNNVTETNYIKSSETLTEEENQTLEQNFGDISMKRTASRFNDRIIIRYVFGEKWIEYSYDGNLSENELEVISEKDRIKWLKDIAGQLSDSENSIQEQEIPELKKNY